MKKIYMYLQTALYCTYNLGYMAYQPAYEYFPYQISILLIDKCSSLELILGVVSTRLLILSFWRS